MNDDGTPAALEVRIDVQSLAVREGTGGFKPLTDSDRREISATMRRLLDTGHHPGAEFVATRFDLSGGSGPVDGTLTVRGRRSPLRLQVTTAGPGRFLATGTVRQTAYGIKPYSAFLGTLKVRDTVDIEAEAGVPTQDGGPG